MKDQRILVTGGAGFIGSHTVKLLLSQGANVTVLDNLANGSLDNLNLSDPSLNFIDGDILDFELIKQLVSESDAVLHLAAIASVPRSLEDPIMTCQVNMQGLLHVLEAIKQTNTNIRLVYASSAAVYGDAKILPCSDHEILSQAFLSPYALQKAQCEQYAKLYFDLYGIKSLGLRYFNVYGENQDPNSPYSGVISRFILGYKQKEILNVSGDGMQSRDFIAVKDVARANVLALNSDEIGAVNIATGKPETLLNLIQYLELAGGDKAKIQFTPARAGDIYESYASVDRAADILHFKAEINLQDGIKAFF